MNPSNTVDMIRREAERVGSAPHLLTVTDDGRPHSVAAGIAWRDDALEVSAGKRSLANVTGRRFVSVLWPAAHAGDYSLIVDGEAALAGSGADARVVVTPTRAVLHRQATSADTMRPGCGADCRPLFG